MDGGYHNCSVYDTKMLKIDLFSSKKLNSVNTNNTHFTGNSGRAEILLNFYKWFRLVPKVQAKSDAYM